jgi:cutinase
MTYSPQIGMDDAINRLNSQNKACPDQKFALIGYSQGAGVMHFAMGPSPGKQMPLLSNRPKLDESVLPKIVAVVMFGDPGFKGTQGPPGRSEPFSAALTARLRQNCSPGDPVSLEIYGCHLCI